MVGDGEPEFDDFGPGAGDGSGPTFDDCVSMVGVGESVVSDGGSVADDAARGTVVSRGEER